MPLKIIPLQLGPMDNNTYLLADTTSGEAVVIDPSFESQAVYETVLQQGWQLKAAWLTHAHFDHIFGLAHLVETCKLPLSIGLHPLDLPLYRQGGGARLFGVTMPVAPEPDLWFEHAQNLSLGSHQIEVRHTPGHSPGHVIFYLTGEATVICGDLIFYHGVGRTDLPGASQKQLIRSIHDQVFTLPSATRLLCGHGPETTVAEEKSQF